LQDEEGYRLINGSSIARIEGDLDAIQPQASGKRLDPIQAEKKERESLAEAEARLKSVNTEVDDEIQSLFINLKTVLTDISWSGKDIRFFSDYIVRGPEYKDVLPLTDEANNERHKYLQGILAKQRSKVKGLN
jgi:hypothetical protein